MAFSRLTSPITLRGRTAPSRVVFGPHPTNLSPSRCFGAAHAAYYRARAAGGAGIVILETTSVHETSRPLEYTPDGTLPEASFAPGLAAAAAGAVQDAGALALLSLAHAGGEGTSHWNQRELWAPSPLPEVNSREVPKAMDRRDADEVVAGFARGADLACRGGLDGVEVGAGPGTLLRQFLSPLTNHRQDELGGELAGRLRLPLAVLRAVRDALGPDRILALRVTGDEHAPWGGLIPEQAAEVAVALVREGGIDLLVVTSGGPYSRHLERAGLYAPPQHAAHLARGVAGALRSAGLREGVAVVAQGSIVDPEAAEALLGGAPADHEDAGPEDAAVDAVEMTRALIADPALVDKLRRGVRGEVRPCLLCNQDCLVASVQNPRIGCVHNPAAGHEGDPELGPLVPARRPRRVLVVGAGPGGLEAARVAAERGHRVMVVERRPAAGGALRHGAARAPGRERLALATDWLEARCVDAGVAFRFDEEVTVASLADEPPDAVVLATGARAQAFPHLELTEAEVPVLSVRALLDPDGPEAGGPGMALPDPPGHAVVLDEEGGHPGMGAAEHLRERGFAVTLLTADMFAGQRLTATQELTPWNQRAHAAGIVFRPQLVPTAVRGRSVLATDLFDHSPVTIGPVDLVVTAAYELPADDLYLALRAGAAGPGVDVHRVGDAVAPRRLSQAVLEGTRIGRIL